MNKPLALIVEDDRDIAALFRHVLDIAGYRTEIALNGSIALELINNCQPNIILLDLNLPGVSGIEIIKKIRSQEATRNIKIVVATGYSNIVENLPYEPDLVLIKPVNVEQLTNLIKRLHPTDNNLEARPHDGVTGLYNKNFFVSRLEYALARSKQMDQDRFGVILIDIPDFQTIELNQGTDTGKRLLQEAANTIKRVLRPTDTIGRYNQTCFIILVEDIPGKDALDMIGDRVQKGLRQSLRNFGKDYYINTAMGLVLCDSNQQKTENILNEAVKALGAVQSAI